MSLIDDIKSHVHVSDVAAQYGDVKRHGCVQVCRCLCGENTDRNPSFTLYEDDPRDGHFHCFACQRHGSVIDLVMLVERIDLRQALAWLRERYLGGTGLRESPSIIRQTSSAKRPPFVLSDQVWAMLEAATEHYHHTLLSTPAALGHLHRRGLSDAVIHTMRLGYSDGTLGRYLHAHGHDLGVAAQVGLLSTHGEAMAQRLIFPVLDRDGAPVWMLGRATRDGQQPKYLGLPDGLTRKRPMVAGHPKRGIMLIEGAVDFAALVQWGMPQAWLCVGLLGTAHSAVIEQLAQHHSHAQVVLLLDQDAAGKDAALKASLALRERGLQPLIVVDADRHAQQQTFLAANLRLQSTALASVSREVALVEQMQQHGLVRWVHWRGEAMFWQAVNPSC